jgi:hypothetical protein
LQAFGGIHQCLHSIRQQRETVIELLGISLFNRGGYIEEKIYDYNNDPDEIVEAVMNMSVDDVLKK